MAAILEVCMQSKKMRISHARSWKKGKYKIVDNHSTCLKAKIKLTESKPNKKDCKVYTRIYLVWTVKTILIIFEMLLNPVHLSGGSVWTSIHTHIQRWSLQYLGLDTPSGWSESLYSRLVLGASQPGPEADGYPGTALGRCCGSFSAYVPGVSPPAILPLCSLCLWREAF